MCYPDTFSQDNWGCTKFYAILGVNLSNFVWWKLAIFNDNLKEQDDYEYENEIGIKDKITMKRTLKMKMTPQNENDLQNVNNNTMVLLLVRLPFMGLSHHDQNFSLKW